MRFKIYYLQIAFLFISINGYTQKDSLLIYKNIIHAEAGGIGAYGSLNYERVVPLQGLFSFSGRIGLGTIRLYDFTNKFNPDVLIPITINGFYGKDHKIHIGFGQLIANNVRASHGVGKPERETNLHTHITIGYRYQKDGGRLILGLSYTPMLEYQEVYRHWGALTLGFAF